MAAPMRHTAPPPQAGGDKVGGQAAASFATAQSADRPGPLYLGMGSIW